MIIEASLYWKGVWDITTQKVSYEITDQAGIYMILTGKKETILRRWRLLDQIIYIGHSKNIRKGLRDSTLWSQWEENNRNSLVVKVAPMYDDHDPEMLVKCLIHNFPSICNPPIAEDEVLTGDILEVKNKTQKFPLGDNCQWAVTIPKPEPEGEGMKYSVHD